MVTGAVDSVTRAVVPVEARRGSRREEAGADGVGVDGAMGFDLVLNVARDTLSVRARQIGSDSLSSEQMFEARGGTAQARREAAMRENYQRDLQAGSPARYDRSSVGVRSKMKAATSDATVSAAQPAGDPARVPRDHVERPGPTPSKNPSPPPMSESTVRPETSLRGGSVVRALSGTPQSEKSKPPASTSTNVTGVSRTVALATSGQAADTVAGKLGQALGAARVSGAESSRAAAPAGDPSASRDLQTSPKKSSGTAQFQPSQSDGRADRSRLGSEAAPNKFDELVRSIRMRSGKWQSSARMHLNPPKLGRVQIDVRMDGERLLIDVRTESADATKALTERSADLRAALAEQGIIVDRFDIDTYAFHGSGTEGGVGGDFDQMAGQREAGSGAGKTSVRTGAGTRDTGHTDSIVEDWQVVAERRLDIKV